MFIGLRNCMMVSCLGLIIDDLVIIDCSASIADGQLRDSASWFCNLQ